VSPDDTRKLFETYQRAWDARDAEALTGHHHEHGTIISPIFRTVRGRREILESYRSLFSTFPDWTYKGQQPVVDGNRIAQPFTVQATHAGDFMGLAGSGRRFEIEGVRVFEMTDGLIGHERRYYDFTGMLIQLGVLRGKPARP
jgi:steroid delta-isomerase-like uncharacterized protein